MHKNTWLGKRNHVFTRRDVSRFSSLPSPLELHLQSCQVRNNYRQHNMTHFVEMLILYVANNTYKHERISGLRDVNCQHLVPATELREHEVKKL